MSFKTPSLFRSLTAYRMTSDVPLLSDLAGLNEQLAKNPERLPTFSQLSAHGWRPTLATRRYEQDQEGMDPEFLEEEEGDRRFVNAPDGRANSLIHLEMIKWERQVPNWEVRNRMRERIDKLELNEKRKVYKKERDQIKDEVVKDVMIKAFVKASTINVLILPDHRLILIDNASARKCEDVLSMLREATNGLPVRPITTRIEPCVTMTDWLKNKKATNGFKLLDGLIMQDDEKGKVMMVNQDVTDDVVIDHIGHGLQATKLALAHDEIYFVLEQVNNASSFVIRKLYHSDLVADQFYAANGEGADPITENNGLHILQAESLRKLVTNLTEALGGEQTPTTLVGTKTETVH